MPSFYLRRKKELSPGEGEAGDPSIRLSKRSTSSFPPGVAFTIKGAAKHDVADFFEMGEEKTSWSFGCPIERSKRFPKGRIPIYRRIGVPSSSPGCLTSRQSWMICERKRMRKRRRVLIQYCIRGERYLFSRPLPSHPLSTASVFNIAPNKRNLKEDGRATTIAANIHHASHASR